MSDLAELGFKVKVPREVLQELKDLRNRNKTSHQERSMIDVALEMLEKKGVNKVSFGGGRVDVGLIEKGKQGVYIATLDNGIKREIPNKIIINNSKKGLEVVRD